ncbi:PaaI family thioesterase [Nocardia sp. NPDC050406]|uniref:PaaI family thioesterase n=1 Tax=Nocardia sp. NPDC050406 TaxID=3364318 RepID=UPI0037A9F8DF
MALGETITIPENVHGYPEVAFGGWVAGLLAGRSGAQTVRVDFRRAVPVGSPVVLPPADGERVTLTDTDGTLLVEAAPSSLTVAAPPAPSWSEAKRATETALSSPKRPVTDCYGCGVDVAPGRGLRLFPWALPDRQIMAAAWTPDQGLADEFGELPPEVVWSTLDCPGGIAAWVFSKLGQGAFTAALTATQFQPVLAGAEYIAYAWPLHGEGRKRTVGVALSTPDGDLCALAEALWIGPRPA